MMMDDGLEGYRGDLNDRCVTIAGSPQTCGVSDLYEREVAYLPAHRSGRTKTQLAPSARF